MPSETAILFATCHTANTIRAGQYVFAAYGMYPRTLTTNTSTTIQRDGRSGSSALLFVAAAMANGSRARRMPSTPPASASRRQRPLRGNLTNAVHSSCMRLVAVWLVALVALPFTAPFASFSLADLLAVSHSPKTTVTAAQTVYGAQDDDADDTAASDACVQRINPATAFALALVASPLAGDGLTAGTQDVLLSAASLPAPGVSVLTPTLRL
jgi:hypothetical protein